MGRYKGASMRVHFICPRCGRKDHFKSSNPLHLWDCIECGYRFDWEKNKDKTIIEEDFLLNMKEADMSKINIKSDLTYEGTVITDIEGKIIPVNKLRIEMAPNQPTRVLMEVLVKGSIDWEAK